MWNPKAELVKKSVEIAKVKHPKGFNKEQLIECSEEVYGGFAKEINNPFPSKKIKTMEDVNNMGNAMANIDGHYPTGMSTCMIVGINGDCGLECPAYLAGECGEPQEFLPLYGSELEQHNELY